MAQTTGTASFYNNLRSVKVATTDSIIYLDSNSIVPGTVVVVGMDAACYELDVHHARIQFLPSCTFPDSVEVHFRVFPFSFSEPYALGKFSYDSLKVFKSYYGNQDNDGQQNTLQFNALDYLGAYSRSMNLGNSQSLSLNSNFNFQINGYLLDSIRIEGAITDNQIPFQPDGNTQRIQEFDRLYLIFERGKHKLTLGDYSLSKPTSYFLSFNKRVQGILYEGTQLGKGKIKNTLQVSGSIAKGQFARNIFNGIEGNQGPYKLTGNNGEQFFILLAGTEKVYIDGIIMERGEDRDYIINYNTGEVTFMPRILITKDKRIQIEFEYQDRNYLNSLFYFSDKLEINEKLSFQFNAYTNQDAKNQPYLQSIDDNQRRFLFNLGDDINNAFYNSVHVSPYAANKILYIQKDTVDANTGILYQDIFEYAKDSTQTLYDLSFSYVGEKKGNYIVSGENTNGRSYQWVPAMDGVAQGAYEPVILLVTPKLHQVFTAAATYKLDSLKVLNIEASMSNYDPNLFAPNAGLNHQGYAGKIDYTEKRFLGKADSNKVRNWAWDNAINYEYVQSNYKVIAPYREVEFFRDWNVIEADSVLSDEHIFNYATQLSLRNWGNVKYQYTYFQRGNSYTANKNEGGIHYQRNNAKAGVEMNIMQSESLHILSVFSRPGIYAEHTFPTLNHLTLGGRYDIENNELRSPQSDGLLSAAYSFDVYNAYIKGGNSEDLTYSINYKLRKDRAVIDSAFQDKNKGHNVDITAGIHKWENHQIDFTGGYRELLVYDTLFTQAEAPGKTMIGRLNYTGNFKNGFFTPTLLYEFGSGQEQKRSYTYVEVAQGQGMYYWVDYNNDGIQQANEFELGLYPDQKKYVRIITPNNEYVKVNFYRLNVAFLLNFAQLFEPKSINPQNPNERKTLTPFAAFMSKISNQFSMESSNRLLAEAGMAAYIPFKASFEDTQVISYSNNIINSFFFNRANPKWGLEYITNYAGMKALLTYGLETSQWMRHIGQFRYSFNKKYSTQLKFKSGYRSYFSGVDDGRTYHYDNIGGSAAFTYIYQTKMRLTSNYEYDLRKMKPTLGNQKAVIHSGGLDARFSFRNIGSIQAGASLSIIDFNGNENDGVGFAMLDALKKGNNFLWNLQWTTKISKGIELGIQYDGRKPGGTKTIHTASMSLRALL